jgi:hypothetical protein
MAFLITGRNLQSISKSKAFWVGGQETDVTVTLLETALRMGWHEWAGIVGMDLDSNSLILQTS